MGKNDTKAATSSPLSPKSEPSHDDSSSSSAPKSASLFVPSSRLFSSRRKSNEAPPPFLDPKLTSKEAEVARQASVHPSVSFNTPQNAQDSAATRESRFAALGTGDLLLSLVII